MTYAWAILVSMFPSFPCYKEGTGGRGQIEPGPLVVFLLGTARRSERDSAELVYKLI